MHTRRIFRTLGLIFFFLGLSALATLPQFPGLWLLPFIFGFISVFIYGLRQLGRDLSQLGKTLLNNKTLKRLTLALIILLAAGRLTIAPVFNLGAPPETTLNSETLALLKKLPDKVDIEVFTGDSEEAVRYLLDLYLRASDKIKVSFKKAQGQTETSKRELVLVKPNSATIKNGNFEEKISPITQRTLNASLRRLISPTRLIYNLTGDSEKAVVDTGPMGLSFLRKELSNQKIMIKDYYWPSAVELPLETDALILAGPRQPLSEERQTAIFNYLAKGGRLLILSDPLVAGLDPEILAPLGLSLPEGLMIDPGNALAGTEDFFIINHDFPAHPITLGLKQPVLWPLTGAIVAREFPPGNDQNLTGHTWAIALSGDSSWLETDRNSLAEKNQRYQVSDDLSGPLALATATTLSNGGRLVLAADADLAANSFIGYAGNLTLVKNMVYWLLEAEADLVIPSPPEGLTLSKARLKILFWLPAVILPLAAFFTWLGFFLRRENRGS